MSTQPQSPVPPRGAQVPQAGSAPSPARRRLLRGGLAAAPVLMASAPRSVMAGTCVTGSLYTSFSPNTALSRNPAVFNCSGKTPEYWSSALATEWPVVVIGTPGPSTPFHPYFTGTAFTKPGPIAGTTVSKTFLEVLNESGTTGQVGMARNLVAAVLNLKKGLMPAGVADEGRLKQVWSDRLNLGYYSPTAAVRWDHDNPVPGYGVGAINLWLRSTMS